MVHLTLSSTKGNQGLRWFPYTGYLGLTPIRVEGAVRTKMDSDLKLLSAKSITVSVKCYETRVGRINNIQSNVLVDYTKTLWSKQDDVEFEQIGNLDFPFRISIPAKVAGFSTAAFVDYRCMWRIEAVLNHVPICGVGVRQIRHFELPLVRYDVPIYSSITPHGPPLLNQQTNKPRAPRIRYSINSPQVPIGPLDLVPISIHLLPVDHGVSIRSASVIVERRIQLHDQVPNASGSISVPQTPTTLRSASSSSSSPKQSPGPCFPKSSYFQEDPLPDAVSSTPSLSSSIPTITPDTASSISLTIASESTPLLHPNLPSSTKLVVNPVTGTESSGTLYRDENGVWSRTLTIQWPAVKSHSLWAIGETISSDLVSVKYFVRTKIVVSFSSGTESIDLADQELLVVSTNEAERQLALAKYNERYEFASVQNTARSKSKSPRRSRPYPGEPLPPTPVIRDSTNSSSTPCKSKTRSRRPHTSAGPRDKPMSFAYGRPREDGGGSSPTNMSGEDIVSSNNGQGNGISGSKRRSELVIPNTTLRPESRDSAAKQPRIDGWKPNFWPPTLAPRAMKGATSGSSASTTASSSSISSSSPEEDLGHTSAMQEWQQELAKIEVKTRKSTDFLGFFKRKRSDQG
ncbi:hypothetical protein BYT27DRAFT_7092656 [Phlegmacium glaucopus]|nr:hypothetical protein BYT27DRAFT_7092656 [Phlegmacium glaucopus]